jgi:peptidoglycan/xylan/chitin deacetylase (PgdA/CDA1 family)
LTVESANISRRLFLGSSLLTMAAPLVTGCGGMDPVFNRRNHLLSPHRRPRMVIAEGQPTATTPLLRGVSSMSPLKLGERVAGLYPKDVLAPWISLTFDDGPRPDWTPRVLKLLAEYGVTATFFVVGRMAERYPDIIKQIAAEGHQLGNHTYSHANLAVLSSQAITEELDRAQEAIDKALGDHYELRLVRPPYGSPWYGAWKEEEKARVADAIAERNAFCILWHIGTSDTLPSCTTDSVVHGLSKAIVKGRGGSVIFHPTKCAKGSVRSVLRMLRREQTATASPYHLLEAKYDCAWQNIAALPTVVS